MNRILVIAPHPDDEAIGCGGTLHRHAENGDDLWTIFLTSGENGRRGAAKEETARIREAEARIAAAILGISHVDFWREPDGALSANPRVVSRLRALVRDWKPAVVYVPHQDEMHVDHRAAFRIVRAAVAGTAEVAAEVAMYEVWTPIQRIGRVEDISEHVNAKREAIRAYRSQAEVIDFAEAILGLNRYRGEMHSWPGGRYAEIFRTWRVDPNPRLPDSSAAAEPEETATIHHSAPPEGSRSSARRRL